MYYLYGFITSALALIALPFVLVAAAVSPRLRKGLEQRLALSLPAAERKDRVLVQLASVGEVHSGRDLVRELTAKLGTERVVLSVMTPTGYDEVKKVFPDHDVAFFPADAGEIPERWLLRRGIAKVILFETELWPMFLLTCFRRAIPVAVVNARISDKSFPNYRRLLFVLAPIFHSLSVVAAQTEEYKKRLITLGVKEERLIVTGNIKFDLSVAHKANEELQALLTAWTSGRRLLIFASTHEGEEEALYRGVEDLLKKYPDAVALFAPRHKERFEVVWTSMQRRFPEAVRRTQVKGSLSPDHRILLLDTHGELGLCFRVGYASFLGGSLVKIGGHNVLEPASESVPVVVGTHMENFRAETDLLVSAGGLKQAADAAGVCKALEAWLSDPAAAKAAGEAAKRVVLENRGALKSTLDILVSSGFLG